MPPLEDERARDDLAPVVVSVNPLAPAVVPAAIPVLLPAASVPGARLEAPRPRNRPVVPEVRSDRQAAVLGGEEQPRSKLGNKLSGNKNGLTDKMRSAHSTKERRPGAYAQQRATLCSPRVAKLNVISSATCGQWLKSGSVLQLWL
jgi:hypothetical protein